MKNYLAVASSVALASLALSACGESDGTATAHSPPEALDVLSADFSRCPYDSQREFTAGGWSGSVAGAITCDEAGSLIQQHFLRDAGRSGALDASEADSIRTSDPGRFTSAGYECATFPLPDGMGWHVLCSDATSHISLYFTP